MSKTDRNARYKNTENTEKRERDTGTQVSLLPESIISLKKLRKKLHLKFTN